MDVAVEVMRETTIRLGAAVLVGTAVGLHRHLRHRPAGVRTHALVALAAAVVTSGCALALPPPSSLAPAVQGVVTGVGFLGAGVIMRPTHEDSEVLGLTTAASVWLVAALGAILGLGQWVVVVPATLLTALVLAGGGFLENLVSRRVVGAGLPPKNTQQPPSS